MGVLLGNVFTAWGLLSRRYSLTSGDRSDLNANLVYVLATPSFDLPVLSISVRLHLYWPTLASFPALPVSNPINVIIISRAPHSTYGPLCAVGPILLLPSLVVIGLQYWPYFLAGVLPVDAAQRKLDIDAIAFSSARYAGKQM